MSSKVAAVEGRELNDEKSDVTNAGAIEEPNDGGLGPSYKPGLPWCWTWEVCLLVVWKSWANRSLCVSRQQRKGAVFGAANNYGRVMTVPWELVRLVR
jgi:hypothetical protein